MVFIIWVVPAPNGPMWLLKLPHTVAVNSALGAFLCQYSPWYCTEGLPNSFCTGNHLRQVGFVLLLLSPNVPVARSDAAFPKPARCPLLACKQLS